MPNQTPFRLTAITRSKTSSGYSVIGATTPSMPALLKKTSIRPKRSMLASTVALDVPRTCDVGLDGVRLRAGPFDRFQGAREVGVLEVDDHDARSLRREALGGGPPDATRAARDHGDLTLEPSLRHQALLLAANYTNVGCS